MEFFGFCFCQKNCANFIQKMCTLGHIHPYFFSLFTAITVQLKIVAMDLTFLHLVGFPLCRLRCKSV